ncbi:MAG: shikimate kinase [Alphaproteobacteria bacterium]|nr:MAG: hypothetical protein B6I23_01560 [Rickettsiaceae bacterium 4572_127]
MTKLELKIKKPIVFVGLMGAGKTTIGRRVASNLGLKFNDLDKEIERTSNFSIIELFSIYGEEWFRKGEAGVLKRMLETAPIQKVLSTGEGAFLAKENRKMIKEKAISIWLKADLDLLVRRTSYKKTRPQLLNTDSRKVLQKLMEERSAIYAEADIIIETKNESLKKTADKVLEVLNEKLCQ